MASDLLETGAIALGGGAVSGGVVFAWMKFLTTRLFRQYDHLHEKHEAKLEKLVERVGDALSAINARLAAFEVRAAETQVLRDAYERTNNKVGRLEAIVEKHSKDLIIAHTKIRTLQGV